MPIQLVFLLGTLGFVLYTSKSKAPPTAAPPLQSNNSATGVSGQPGIQSALTQALQALGIGKQTGTAQNTNQTNYGGSKQFMGPPATPVSTQIINAASQVNWGSVAKNAGDVWNNLFGDSGNVAANDPQPDLSNMMDGSDSIDANSAWDNAPSYPGDSGQTYDA